MSGNAMCDYKLWFKANYQDWPKPPSDFDFASWNTAHTLLTRKIIHQTRSDGYVVKIEGQNSFFTTTKDGIRVSGKPDIVIYDHDANTATVVDAKTGKPSASHGVQVQLYAWFMAPNLSGYIIHGYLEYPDGKRQGVTIDFSNRDFTNALNLAYATILEMDPPHKIPSEWECRFCDIAECDARFADD
jgi:CRISPR/Cas system-associated exonuclease Cas4 (RecB family)